MAEIFSRERYETEDAWLKARAVPARTPFRITATNAAVIMGLSPWQTPSGLYDEKVGLVPPKDIGNKPYVIYGKAMEPHIREAAMLDLPYFRLDYHQYDILTNNEDPWMSCTLDGELCVATDNPWSLAKGEPGALECKTGTFRRESDLQEWEEGIPAHYYCQTLHQLNTTGWTYDIVAARLIREGFKDSDLGFPEVRTYYRIVDLRNNRTYRDARTVRDAERDYYKALVERRRPATRITFGE